jgi:hypothetical protein
MTAPEPCSVSKAGEVFSLAEANGTGPRHPRPIEVRFTEVADACY